LKTFRSRHASLLYQILLGARRSKTPWRSEASRRSTIFCRPPVVGVPIAEVANTLVSWFRWMVSSYVGHLDTKTTSLRSACCKYLGLAIPRYIYGSANLVGAPQIRDLLRSVCFCKPCQPALDTKDFTSGMKASLWGARLMALPSASRCLGAIDLRPSLGRHASSGPAKLFAAMQDI
jgi:hypothetical protein